jgi:hypothetical protein
MILSMLKSLGRSIFTFFARPAPTSVALMAGPRPGLAANDDQSQMLRRAMQAATAAEDARDDGADEIVQNFEPISIDEIDDSAAAQAAVFAPAKPAPVAAANDAVTHDAVEQPAFEAVVAAPIEFADWVEVEIDEHAAAAAEAEFVLHAFEASLADIGELVREESGAAVLDEAVLEGGGDVAVDEEPVTIEAEPVVSAAAPVIDEPMIDEPVADLALETAVEVAGEETADEAVVEAVADETADETVVEAVVVETAREDADVLEDAASEDAPALTDEVVAAVADDVVEKKARKKKAPAKKKAAAKPRKARADDVVAEPVPADDVWVSDAVAWSLSGEWSDEAQVPAESSDCPRRLEELREAAAEGRLTIWGRTGDAGTWQPIEASYWKSGTVAPASLAEGRENVVAEPKTKGKAKASRKYSALKVSRAQVEELWQPDAMH